MNEQKFTDVINDTMDYIEMYLVKKDGRLSTEESEALQQLEQLCKDGLNINSARWMLKFMGKR